MKNNNKQGISPELEFISSLINQAKFKEALEKLESFEKQNPNDTNFQFNKLGFLVDIGFGLKNKNIVQQGLDIGENNLINPKYTKHKTSVHYNLANGYLSLYELSEKKDIESIPQSEDLQKAKSHFRKAIEICNDNVPNLKKQMWVNYGNCLDNLGRTVEAFYAYDEALKIDNEFSMAIGNKAKASCFFADISREYRTAIYIEAHQAISPIINKPDLIEIGGIAAKIGFEKKLEKIESLFKDKSILKKNMEHPKYDTENLSDFEKYYIDFCIKENLFLNFHIHQGHCEAAIKDPIFISLITKGEDGQAFYNLAKYINQIKEDYAVARLLLVQSQHKREDFDRISMRTTFVNCLDYSKFNLYTGLLKSSFKEAYNILDKIAVFINVYYGLGLSEDRIYFTTIWEKEKKIRNEILNSKNFSLYALYDIYQDFKSCHYKEIQNIRRALTHRKLVVFDSMFTDGHKKDNPNNISYDTMLNKTIEVLQLSKAAIIYLINFVNMEENKKRKVGLVAPMYVDTTQFL